MSAIKENKKSTSYWARLIVAHQTKHRNFPVGEEFRTSFKDIKEGIMESGTINCIGWQIPIEKLEFFKLVKETIYTAEEVNPLKLKRK